MREEIEALKQIMKDALRKVALFERNDRITRYKCKEYVKREIINNLNCFDRCTVICDETNNNPEVIDDNNIIIQIYHQSEEQKYEDAGELTILTVSIKDEEITNKFEKKIYKIENGKIVEYIVRPNNLLPGYSVLLKESENEGYYDTFLISNEALERCSFDSIKKSETYSGLENIVYYNSKEEAQEVIDLEKRFKND